MHVIKIDKNDFDDFSKRREATFNAESQIIEDKLKHGINGLEWLIMQVLISDERKESLEQWMKISPMRAKGTKDPLLVFMNAVRLDPDDFYEKHELNWWMAIDEALTYFALLKERDYDTYFDVLQRIYR